jgi:hypothetical protein
MRTVLTQALCVIAALAAVTAGAATGVVLTDLGDRVRVEIEGQRFTEYHYRDVPRPVLYPVIGPGGAHLTRHFPMQVVEGEEHDHPHHRGIQWSHMRINEVSTWSETPGRSGRTVHRRFHQLQSGREVGVLRSENQIVSAEGRPVCDQWLTLRFYRRGPGRLLDYEVELRATQGDLVLGDQKDGGMAIRVAESMRVVQPRAKGQKQAPRGQGHIVNSDGVRDDAAWGRRAKWCDYYGPVGDRTVGVAIFDHPDNPRHPTWWHVRTYGLFSANPFGVSSFEKNPDKNAGNFTVPAGQSIRFRYRFYFHEGDEKEAQVEQLYRDYAAGLAPGAGSP